MHQYIIIVIIIIFKIIQENLVNFKYQYLRFKIN